MRRRDLDHDPARQFARWFAEAGAAGVQAPEAMALATATTDGAPSARIVLLKGHGADGYVFFTDHRGRKAQELAANPRAALLFHWDAPGRQVRIEGAVGPVTTAESEAYYRSRPLASRLGAWASHQSAVVADRPALEARLRELTERIGNDPPLPPHWGGYRLVPLAYEFWEHHDDRLHDRFRYRPDGAGGWRIDRLMP